VDWTVSIESRSSRLLLSDDDREAVRRRLAFTLSRFSDRLERIEVALDVTFPLAGVDEFLCDLEGHITGCRGIRVITRGRTMEEAIGRGADRAARAVDRALQELRAS